MGKFYHPSTIAIPLRAGFHKKRQIAMKKMKFLPPVLVLLCAGLFAGYQSWDRINTDMTPPEITVGTETIQTSVAAPRSTLLRGVTAADDRDGDVTDSLVVESINALDSSGTVQVTFAAFDQAGNVAKGSRTVRYTDYQAPRFSLNRAMIYDANSNFDPLNNITASDSLDGNITHRIRAMSMDDASVAALGDHKVEFRVTNSLGDTVRLTLPVTAHASDAYKLGLELEQYLVYLNRGAVFEAEHYLSDVTYNLVSVLEEGELPAGYSIHIEDSVNTNIPGVYPVDYTVTFERATNNGTEYITGFTRLIVVVEG